MNRGNFQKTPLGPSLNRIAQAKVIDAVQVAGKALPCSVAKVRGQIVTVKFEINSGFTLPQVTVPIIGAEYLRLPTQTGDKGVVFPADAYLGGVSGLGGGTADLTQRANLTALVFSPIGNVSFFSVNPNVATLYGPAGVTLQDTTGAATILLTPTSITMTVGGKVLILNASGLTFDGKSWDNHVHLYTPGTGTPINTGPPLL